MQRVIEKKKKENVSYSYVAWIPTKKVSPSRCIYTKWLEREYSRTRVCTKKVKAMSLVSFLSGFSRLWVFQGKTARDKSWSGPYERHKVLSYPERQGQWW